MFNYMDPCSIMVGMSDVMEQAETQCLLNGQGRPCKTKLLGPCVICILFSWMIDVGV